MTEAVRLIADEVRGELSRREDAWRPVAIVFTHDNRLPEEVRRLGISATVFGVTRRANSVVKVRKATDPVTGHLDDAWRWVAGADRQGVRCILKRHRPFADCRYGLQRYKTMAIFPFINLKGGVAKTTNAVAVAEAFASRGRRVLVIDADHQCTASELLLGESRMLEAERGQTTLHDLFRDMFEVDFSADQFDGFVLNHASNVKEAQSRLYILPSSVRLDEFQTNLARARRGYATGEEFNAAWRRHNRLFQRWLKDHFDHVIIDCPPSLTPHVRFVLQLCDGYIIPSIPDHLSVRGVLRLQERLAKKGMKCPPLGTLWTLFRAQVERHRNIISLVDRRAGRLGGVPVAFKAVIPNAAAIAGAVENGGPHASFVAKYTRPFARLYLELCGEIEARFRGLGHAVPGHLFA